MPKVVPISRAVRVRRAGKPAGPLSAEEIARLVNDEPAGLDIDLDSIVRLVDETAAANDSNEQPVVSSGAAELGLRQLIAKYGFERMPLTLGELQGLLEYANILEYATGEGFKPGVHKQRWQQDALEVYRAGFSAPWVPGVELYLKGDLAALRAYHREGDWLTRLGRDYRAFDAE